MLRGRVATTRPSRSRELGRVVAGPLLESKTRIPGGRPGAVPRPRLTGRLAAAPTSALTVLSASAGFGKTTLLTEWLATLPAGGPAVAWLSLDGRDDDPTLFWTYVVAALRTVHPDARRRGAGAAGRRRRRDETRPRRAAQRPERTAARPAAGPRRLPPRRGPRDPRRDGVPAGPPAAAAAPGPRHPDRPAAAAGAAAGPRPAGRGPRRRPALHRRGVGGVPQRLDGPVADRGRRRRRSTPAPRAGSPPCSWRHCRCRAATTSAPSSPGSPATTATSSTTSPRRCWPASPTRSATSCCRPRILERLTGPLCDAVTGRPGGTAMLEALERANLFLVPLDDRRQWYRYHHLFADVLQAHLLEEHGADVAELHRRASAWFADRRAAGRRPSSTPWPPGTSRRAADLMELAMPRCSRGPAGVRAPRWVRVLPDDVVRVRPVLGVVFVGALAQVSDFDTVAAPARRTSTTCCAGPGSTGSAAPGRTQPPPGAVVVDVEGFRRCPPRSRCTGPPWRSRPATSTARSRHAREAMSLAPPDDHLARAAAAALAGLASWTTGDLAGAHAGYTEAVAGLQRVGLRRRRPRAAASRSATSADPGPARRRAAHLRAGPRARRRRARRRRCGEPPTCTSASPSVLLERDDLAAAAEHLATSHQLGEHNGLPQNPYRWRRRDGPAAGGRGRPRRRARAARRGGPRLQRRLLPERAAGSRRCAPGCGCGAASSSHAAAWARGAAAVRGRRAVVPARVRARHARPAAARAARGGSRTATRLDEATTCSTGCSRRPTRAGGRGSVIEMLVLQALAQQAAGRHRGRARARCSAR